MPRYEFAMRPYRHQAAALRKLRSGGFGGALLCEPRTGKTKIAIDWMCVEALANDVRRWVVVAPRRVIPVWMEQFSIHAGSVDGRRVVIHSQVWDAAARRLGPPEEISPELGADLSVVLVNYEAFSTARANEVVRDLIQWVGGKVPREAAKNRGKRRRKSIPSGVEAPAQPAGMILDESHKIKSPSGNASQMIVSMRSIFDRRLIMTGTPVTGEDKLADCWMQWQFLNPSRFEDLPTYRKFKDHYAHWIQQGGWERMGRIKPKGMADIRRRIRMDSYIANRRECLDIPDAKPRDVFVELTPRTKRVYSELAEEMIVQLEQGDLTASTAAIKSLRLSQVAAGVARVGEGSAARSVRIGREKLDALADLLEESFDHEEKVVVACRFRVDIVSVLAMAKKKWPNVPAYRLDGTTDPDMMSTQLRLFQNHSGAALYVIQPQAGGVGIDLSSASRFVWYTLDLSWINYKQCSDRVALNPHCDIVHLIARGTVDVRHLAALRRDGEVGAWMIEQPSLLRLDS